MFSLVSLDAADFLRLVADFGADFFWEVLNLGFRERELHINFFSQTFRAPPEYPGKIPGYPAQKVWFPLFSKDIPNFLAFTWKTPTPPENIRTKKFGSGFFFLA